MNEDINSPLTTRKRYSLGLPAYNDKYNIIIMGDEKVGKTTLLKNLMELKFKPYFRIIGNDAINKDIKNVSLEYTPNENEIYLIKIWNYCHISDKQLINDFMSKADAFVIIYSVTDKKSFDNIDKWVNEAENNTTCKNVSFYIVGNKFDLENKIQVGEGEILKLEKKTKYKFFRMTSLSSEELDKTFNIIFSDVVNVNYSEMESEESDSEEGNKKSKKCCKCKCNIF